MSEKENCIIKESLIYQNELFIVQDVFYFEKDYIDGPI